MENLITRNIKARNLLHQGEIDPKDYLLMKLVCRNRIKQLSDELKILLKRELKTKNKTSKKIQALVKLGKFYQKSDSTSLAKDCFPADTP